MENEQQALATPAPQKAAELQPKKESSSLSENDKRKITKAVMETTTDVLNPVEHEQLRKLAKEYYLAGALPKGYTSPEQIMLAMQFGRTMGMTPYESVINGYFVNGSYNVWGKAVPAALRRHGWRWQFVDETPEGCTVQMSNPKTGEIIEDTFTYQDAVASGFTSSKGGDYKVGWKEGANRKRKLRYGVLSQVLHTYIPEVLGAVSGIAEYSEDYLESAQPQMDTDKTRQRIEAAEAEVLASKDPDFSPVVVQPEVKEADQSAFTNESA